MHKKSSDSVGEFFSAYIWLKKCKDNIHENNRNALLNAGIDKKRHIYVSEITSTAIVILNSKELERLKMDKNFEGWSYYEFDEPETAEEDILLTQIGADSITGTNSTFFNNGTGYNGDGIKVGVISAENLIFDENALSLRDTSIKVLPSFLPPKKDTHPTAVISQIAGQKVIADSITFFGVVRSAEVIFASAKTTKNVYTAIEEMVKEGVKIINYSAGIIKGGYSDFDRQIDRLSSAGNFLFVTVSGNSRDMTSPGLAHNGIAVGNLLTKSYPTTPLPSPWEVWCKSEDDCSGFSNVGVHKPDLVAPGAWIGYVEENGNANFNNFGTSFACPWVSGIACAVLQALGGNYSYMTVKAILLMSCNSEAVSEVGNPKISEYVRLRSGYGLVDGTKAVKIAESSEIYESTLDGEYNVEAIGGCLEIMLVAESDSVTLMVGEDVYSTGKENTLLVKRRSNESFTPLSVFGIGGGRFSLVVYKNDLSCS